MLNRFEIMDTERALRRLDEGDGSGDAINVAGTSTYEDAKAMQYGMNLVDGSEKGGNNTTKAPAAVKGARFSIVNTGDNGVKLYPSTQDDASHINESKSAITINGGATAEFICPKDGEWYQCASFGWAG